MESSEYQLNSIVEMKKPHPCSTHCKEFEVIRLGCGNIIMLPRNDFNKKAKRVIKK